MRFSQLAVMVDGDLINLFEDQSVEHLITDSRRAYGNISSLFFALRGPNHDGHKYLQEVYQLGIRQFIVEKGAKVDKEMFPLANILAVENSLTALQQIASFHRRQFELEVLGITGSNGKTIVKEWLSQLLAPEFSIIKSPKSYNSQLGVPLSVWEISDKNTLGIFEAGISKAGEMERLEKIIIPSLGLLTSLGSAHDEGFESHEQKLKEKALLFQNSKRIFYCEDHALVAEYLKAIFPEKRLFSWSVRSNTANLFFSEIKKGKKITEVRGVFEELPFSLAIPFEDDASIENALHCVALMLYFKIPFHEINLRLNSLRKVSMRLELKHGINECYLIDDSYNNDLAGLEMALDFLSRQNQRNRKTLILSDLLEAGMAEKELYNSIAKLLQDKKISKLVAIGPVISKYKSLFTIPAEFYPSTEDFLKTKKENDFNHEVILIKGARVFAFERITATLQRKIHGTVLEISLDALSNNLNFYKSRIKPSTKIMVMVKAFAYGSGSFDVANLLQFHRVDYLAVAYADEGVELRRNGVTLPIMVMNPSPDAFEKMLEHNLEPEIYSPFMLTKLISYLKGVKASFLVHLELETGMRRLGFERDQLEDLISDLQINQENVKVASIFSHLAGSDEATHNDFSTEQIRKFTEMADVLENALGYAPIKHILNSPGIIRFPEAQLDMVRLGIGLYGVEVNELFQDKLIPISTLKTTVSQIKKIKIGETVGYGRRGIAEKESMIGTIAIGYADGFNRAFSRGKGKVMVKGVLAPVIGNVCMDMTMIDVTGIEVSEGEEVIIFGKELPISQMAKWIDTIPYEILTNISERVKRVYFTE